MRMERHLPAHLRRQVDEVQPVSILDAADKGVQLPQSIFACRTMPVLLRSDPLTGAAGPTRKIGGSGRGRLLLRRSCAGRVGATARAAAIWTPPCASAGTILMSIASPRMRLRSHSIFI